MPYNEHPNFMPPTDTKASIWRYLTLSKFLSLLIERSLFFSPADLLDDPLEGSVPVLNPAMRLAQFMAQGVKNPDVIAAQFGDAHRLMRSLVAVNCWRIDEHESAAMWRLYTGESDGIAVKSTFERLTQSLTSAPQPVFIGIVKYVDFASAVIPEGNFFLPLLHKRKSFEYESELRAAVMFGGIDDFKDLARPPAVKGVPVAIDLERLISEVVVSPAAPGWFVERVQTVTTRLGFPFPVRQSDLNSPAVY